MIPLFILIAAGLVVLVQHLGHYFYAGENRNKMKPEEIADAIVNAMVSNGNASDNFNAVIPAEGAVGVGGRKGALTRLSTRDRDEVLRLVKEKLREHRNSSSPNGFVGDPLSWMQSRGVIARLDGALVPPATDVIGNKDVALDVKIQNETDLDRAIWLISRAQGFVPSGDLYVPVREELKQELLKRLQHAGDLDMNRIKFVATADGFYSNQKFNLDLFLPALQQQIKGGDLSNTLLAISGDYAVSDATWAKFHSQLNLQMVLLVEWLNGVLAVLPMTHEQLQKLDQFARLATIAA
jgi:hypothetical protein